jgi:hypothetical protein
MSRMFPFPVAVALANPLPACQRVEGKAGKEAQDTP